MAGTSFRRSVAEPGHLMYGVPTISYCGLAFLLFGSVSFNIGVSWAFFAGIVAMVLTHLFSMIIRFKHPFAENLIWFWIFRKIDDGYKKHPRIYYR